VYLSLIASLRLQSLSLVLSLPLPGNSSLVIYWTFLLMTHWNFTLSMRTSKLINYNLPPSCLCFLTSLFQFMVLIESTQNVTLKLLLTPLGHKVLLILPFSSPDSQFWVTSISFKPLSSYTEITLGPVDLRAPHAQIQPTSDHGLYS
jgi:hypothetical protein